MSATPSIDSARARSISLTKPSAVRALLEELEVKPSRVLGQNFLIDANMIRILTEAAALAPEDRVLEVGPGLGVLTESLLAQGAHVLAIEKDQRLYAWLSMRTVGQDRLELCHADALDCDLPRRYVAGITKLVSNLPYSVGSRILMEAFMSPHRPERIVVTVQKEVADRLVARPDTNDYGLLSVWAQIGYAVRSHKTIPATCFLPAPEIASAIVVMEKLPAPLVAHPLLETFADLVRRGFGQRRKQLGKLLRNEAAFQRAGIDPQSRAEQLAPADWARLAAVWAG